LFAVWLTVVALPILVIDNIPRTEARAASVRAASADALDPSTTITSSPPASEVATTQAEASTTAPTRESPATTVPRATTVRAKTTPTTAAPTTTEPPTVAAANSQEGGASWYDYNPGECAHLSIPKGTVVTVTRISTGASVTCVVTDRGPTGAGRIIDLDRSTFAQLAEPGAGVIQVRITW
jgi:rare lipoprotein A (peptidoglycan hydrolase)